MIDLTWDCPIAVDAQGVVCEATYDYLMATYGAPDAPVDRAALRDAIRAAVAEAMGAASTQARATAIYMTPADFARRLGRPVKAVHRLIPRLTEGVHYVRLDRRLSINVDATMAFISARDEPSSDGGSLMDRFAAKARR